MRRVRQTRKYEQNWNTWHIRDLANYIKTVNKRLKHETVEKIKEKVLRIAQNLALVIITDENDLTFIRDIIKSIQQKLKEVNMDKTIGVCI